LLFGIYAIYLQLCGYYLFATMNT